MTGYLRLWLATLCLLLAVAALWAFSDESQCPNSAWDGGPAIARVGDGCVYSLQYNTYFRDLSLSLGFFGQGAGADESGLGGYLRGRQRLIAELGLENATFATLAQDIALHQEAMREGHFPPDGDVMAVMGANRERIRGLSTLLELHELALESDLDGFRNLIESPEGRQAVPVQSEEHLLALFEEAGKLDLSGAAKGMKIHSALLESVGEDRYWNGAFVEYAGWLGAIESYRLAVDELDSGDPPGLGWQDVREATWGSTAIELTDAAPEGVTLTGVRQYVNGLHALERDLLTR